MEIISPASGCQVFLYCSCRYTTLGFVSIFNGISTPIEIIQIERPEDISKLLDKSKKKLLVVSTHDDSLYFSARAAWFELCWEQSALTKGIIRIHMFSEGGFSRKNGYYDFSLNDSIEQIREHIIMLLNAKLNNKRNVNHSISLTPREKELILCISEGLSVKAIARKMGVSKRTIFVFRMSVIKKMGFRNRNHIHRLNFRCDEGFNGADSLGVQR
ncbi:helix-turn-helix transcriptional regulator [Salmonella enterica]|nr:helix-turn-helix transcriptional regulator [Salmonella enterica]EDR1539092.1 helix-turn-helix transcriptional regulator [Salmonella enterica subsp. enterica serovar Javiana]EGO3302105.1 helix-turn-helix transcriptional regulator [Salmonella enterica]EHC5972870.1 helix-turn-helix transcriptional regulator [Salmonella enterica]EIU9582015.1 helix-turn-helix transcriptional regulator [Salmonella enterica]